MAKRRTRKEKILALARKQVKPAEKKEQTTLSYIPVEKASVKDDYYYPELNLPLNLVRRDLTKTVAVTILALILQFILASHLQRGGWQAVQNFLSNIRI